MNVPAFLEGQAAQVIHFEQQAAEKRCLWAVVYGLAPFLDGDRWCVLLGVNIQNGVCGFGGTPYEALLDFEKSMSRAVDIRKVSDD